MNHAAAKRRAAFDGLVAEHERTVLAICRSILRDEHLGADAAQETFVRLWRRMEEPAELRVTDRAEVGGWLRRVAVTTALDATRRRRVRADADDRRREDSAGEPPAAFPGPLASAEQRELAARLDEALARLPEGQRAVFRLRHEGGLKLREVAEVLGLALPTVKTQFARACLKLQGALRPHQDDEAR